MFQQHALSSYALTCALLTELCKLAVFASVCCSDGTNPTFYIGAPASRRGPTILFVSVCLSLFCLVRLCYLFVLFGLSVRERKHVSLCVFGQRFSIPSAKRKHSVFCSRDRSHIKRVVRMLCVAQGSIPSREANFGIEPHGGSLSWCELLVSPLIRCSTSLDDTF